MFTDTIIPYTSNHPIQHKFTAIRFFYNRLSTNNLPTGERKREEQIIHNILENNSFPICPQKPPSLKQKTDGTQPNRKAKMGHIYIHRERDNIYHKHLQANQHQNSILHQQHHRKQVIALTTDN